MHETSSPWALHKPPLLSLSQTNCEKGNSTGIPLLQKLGTATQEKAPYLSAFRSGQQVPRDLMKTQKPNKNPSEWGLYRPRNNIRICSDLYELIRGKKGGAHHSIPTPYPTRTHTHTTSGPLLRSSEQAPSDRCRG